ncbi:MAG: A/G-specific adenine glycosylase [Syntrophobacteraceae bacterium]|nr:A/G-specific adenine glycosylase [Syntrophobacteraceae bacterium]
MKRPDARTTVSIQGKLLKWFQDHQRDLPWRMHYRPYEVWISEVMLQQTQVRTMLPYYERWMARFPDIRSVAEAPEDTVLKHWEGLGYYNRARNIQRTAGIITREFQGEVPRDYKTLRNLPGIGPYTASAILSLAFNEDRPVVDGNVKRVFSRLFDLSTVLTAPESLRSIEEIARAILPPGRARSFNQALMELGALVCTPRSPRCLHCPIREACVSQVLGLVSQRPVPTPAKALSSIEVAVGVLVSNGRIFIQKRPAGGLMPLLWEFPGGKVKKGETPEAALVRELREELEVQIQILGKIGVIRHSYTSFRVALHAFACRLRDEARLPVLRSATESKWVNREEIADFPFPAANQKLIRMLGAALP